MRGSTRASCRHALFALVSPEGWDADAWHSQILASWRSCENSCGSVFRPSDTGRTEHGADGLGVVVVSAEVVMPRSLAKSSGTARTSQCCRAQQDHPPHQLLDCELGRTHVPHGPLLTCGTRSKPAQQRPRRPARAPRPPRPRPCPLLLMMSSTQWMVVREELAEGRILLIMPPHTIPWPIPQCWSVPVLPWGRPYFHFRFVVTLSVMMQWNRTFQQLACKIPCSSIIQFFVDWPAARAKVVAVSSLEDCKAECSKATGGPGDRQTLKGFIH